MLDESKLSICTISYGHAAHIDLNRTLAARLNPKLEARVDWLVAENAPPSHPRRLSGTESPFRHFPGYFGPARGASDQHARALNALLQEVRTRFVLVLDPDFYILRNGWIDDVVAHMRSNELSFFGAPWHPRFVENYRYFPAVHCMFVDRSRIPLNTLDFRPIHDDASDPRQSADVPVVSRWAAIGRRLRFEHRRRRPWDTGARIFNRFGTDSSVRSECLVPYYQVRQNLLGKNDGLALKSRVLDFILPDDRSYVPKRRGSYTRRGFADRGLSVVPMPAIWEQQFWRDAPFGLHIRGSFGSAVRDPSQELELCKRALDELCPAQGRPL
jgi:hypothetical protein